MQRLDSGSIPEGAGEIRLFTAVRSWCVLADAAPVGRLETVRTGVR